MILFCNAVSAVINSRKSKHYEFDKSFIETLNKRYGKRIICLDFPMFVRPRECVFRKFIQTDGNNLGAYLKVHNNNYIS